jgi:hypothetical protein
MNHRPGGPGGPLHRNAFYLCRPANTLGQSFILTGGTLILFARVFNRQMRESALLCGNEHKL